MSEEIDRNRRMRTLYADSTNLQAGAELHANYGVGA